MATSVSFHFLAQLQESAADSLGTAGRLQYPIDSGRAEYYESQSPA
jgi:hypothetical protein